MLFYNLYAMYNDKRFWKDPENFRPERFINENGEIDKMLADRILNSAFGVGTLTIFFLCDKFDNLIL